MNLTENTRVRIRVPKHLYESIQAELGKMEEEKHEEAMEEGDINEYVGMSPAEVQAMELAGTILAAVAAGTGLTAGIVNLAKKVKGAIQSKKSTEAPVAEPAPEEMEEVLELESLMEAIKVASKKKAEDKKKKEAEAKKKKEVEDKKKKEAEAKKKKEVEDKKKADEKKKKEAEAKKKALKEDIESDYEDWISGKGPQITDGFQEIKPDTEIPIGSSLLVKGRKTFFTLEKINGNRYTLSFDMDGSKFNKTRRQLEADFIFKAPKKK